MQSVRSKYVQYAAQLEQLVTSHRPDGCLVLVSLVDEASFDQVGEILLLDQKRFALRPT